MLVRRLQGEEWTDQRGRQGAAAGVVKAEATRSIGGIPSSGARYKSSTRQLIVALCVIVM